MPLPVPNLDDRSFDQLAAEARSLIPRYLPEWTDHNASDPGITLLDLFAFLTEAAIYQLNRVPPRTIEKFAGLVNVKRAAGESIDDLAGRALDSVAKQDRVTTAGELEAHARGATAGIARVKAIVDVQQAPFVFPADETIRLVVVPNTPGVVAVPTADMLESVFQGTRPYCPITTRLQAMAPRYRTIAIQATVVREAGNRQPKDTLSSTVARALRRFLSPLTGGEDGSGWEFGRPVFRSELYQLIEAVDGVDHVARLLLDGDENVDEIALASDSSSRPITLPALVEATVNVVDR